MSAPLAWNAPLRDKLRFNRCPGLDSEFETHDPRLCEYCRNRKLYNEHRTAADIVSDLLAKDLDKKQITRNQTKGKTFVPGKKPSPGQRHFKFYWS